MKWKKCLYHHAPGTHMCWIPWPLGYSVSGLYIFEVGIRHTPRNRCTHLLSIKISEGVLVCWCYGIVELRSQCLYLVLNTQEASHFYWHQFWGKNDRENIYYWNYFQIPRVLSELPANWPDLTRNLIFSFLFYILIFI